MIVCQATPSAAATGATARSCRPTCSNAHCLARSVRTARDAIAGWSSVHVLLGHNAYRHSKIRFRHRITTGTPAAGRSRTVTVRRSFTRATAPHSPQPTRSLRCFDADMPFAVDHLGREHLESGHAEQRSNVLGHLGLLAS